MSLLSSAHVCIHFLQRYQVIANMNTALHLYTFVTGTDVINTD